MGIPQLPHKVAKKWLIFHDYFSAPKNRIDTASILHFCCAFLINNTYVLVFVFYLRKIIYRQIKKRCSFLNQLPKSIYISRCLYCKAVCITRDFSESQNPRFINESIFKSRTVYNGACTVHQWKSCMWETPCTPSPPCILDHVECRKQPAYWPILPRKR